jgi:hypothetical protein
MNAIQHKRTCRVCGCTDDDCRQCIEKTGEPCYWVEEDLCSACAQTINTNKNYFITSLFIKISGAIIREIVVADKKYFAVMLNCDNIESLYKKFHFPDDVCKKYNSLFENNALKIFPTKKGALGWCRRHNVFIAE